MSKPKVVSVDNKKVARHAAGVFGGEPHVTEYVHDTVDLSVGILSYDGQLTFGLYGDADLCGDVGVLAAGIETSFAELMKAVSRAYARGRFNSYSG